MKENEQNFDALQRLLKLKQHEVPPPGYFDNFSGKVVARIRAGELGRTGSAYERLQMQAPWAARFLAFFEAKHAVFGGLATAVCLFLLFGVILADKADNSLTGVMPGAGNFSAETPIASVTSQPILADNSGGIQISTNAAASLQPMAAVFGQSQNPLLQPASFMGGN